MTKEEIIVATAVMNAFANGARIEGHLGRARLSPLWRRLDTPAWNWQEWNYRIEDPYKKLKEAHERGDVIELTHPPDDPFHGRAWCACSPTWSLPVECYRIRKAPKEVWYCAGLYFDSYKEAYNAKNAVGWHEPIIHFKAVEDWG